jgi:hypothetical protein
LLNSGKAVVIPGICTGKAPRYHGRHLYEAYHLIENFFCTSETVPRHCYALRQNSYGLLSAIDLVASVIWPI